MRSLGLTTQLSRLGLGFALLACSNSSGPEGVGGSGNTQTGTGGSGLGPTQGEGNAVGGPTGQSGAATGTGGTNGQTPPPLGGSGPVVVRTFVPGEGRGGAFVALKPQGGAGSVEVCRELSVVPTPQIPTVAIVLDNSSTMYPPGNQTATWPATLLIDALMNPDTGAIKPLESKVQFGFTAYRSPKGQSLAEDDPACAELTTVPYAFDNYDEINAVYQVVNKEARRPSGLGCAEDPNSDVCRSHEGDGWDTPTGHALNRVAAGLLALEEDPPTRKYMLLVTDGTPNTCRVSDPDCGQDLALKAVQDAFAAGIGTFVIGVGNLANGTSTCDANAGRCGEDHLQDIANAGTGAPVQAPPASYWYSQCAVNAGVDPQTNQGTPQATYAPAGTAPGTSPYFVASTPEELREALGSLLNQVISCTVEMDAIVTGNPAQGIVSVGGTRAQYGDPNGWILEANNYAVTLQGQACETFKTGAKVDIQFPCDPNGNPIAIRR